MKVFLLICLLGLKSVTGDDITPVVHPTTTTNRPTTSSPEPPPTTTLPPNTTTAAPTTTSKPTPSPPTPPTPTPPPTTTVAPVTTTAAPVTTTAAPIKHSVWNVTLDGTNCILAKMEIEFSVPYNTSKNQTMKADFTVLPTASASGECGKEVQWMKLPLGTSANSSVNFIFKYNATTKEYYLNYINITLPVNNATFPNNTWNVTSLDFSYQGELFKNQVNMSYTCASPDPMQFENKNVTGTLKLSSVQVEAFSMHKDMSFSAGMDCVTIETPDIVPIAVGIALALLVVVVLIGFLVSRRRSQARGYLSM